MPQALPMDNSQPADTSLPPVGEEAISEEFVSEEEYQELEQPKSYKTPIIIGSIIAAIMAGLLIMKNKKA